MDPWDYEKIHYVIAVSNFVGEGKGIKHFCLIPFTDINFKSLKYQNNDKIKKQTVANMRRLWKTMFKILEQVIIC